MPNWVENNLTITGDPEDVARVKSQLSAPYERIYSSYVDGEQRIAIKTVKQDFSFWNIVHPTGDELVAYQDSVGLSGTPYWYDWNVNHWGTKWDTDAEFFQYAPDHIRYVFQTAWSPPMEALLELGRQYPNVTVNLEWEEEQGYGGEMDLSQGVYVEISSYDIPDSHAVMMERKGFCHCEHTDEPWYSDCPSADDLNPEFQFSQDELEIEAIN